MAELSSLPSHATAAVLLFVAPLACVHADTPTAAGPTALGQPETYQGPTEQWEATTARAKQAATAHGDVVDQQTLTVSGPIGQATQPFTVEADHCYAASVAWAEPWPAHVSIQFTGGSDGAPVNESLAGRNAQLDAPGGVVQFCADNPGHANYTISALDAQGAAKPVNARYAIALAAREESPDAASARRTAEADRAAQTRSEMAANVEAAQKKRCDHCWDRYLDCRVEHTAQAIGDGKAVDPLAACAPAFRECGFSTPSAAESSPDEWPCGKLTP